MMMLIEAHIQSKNLDPEWIQLISEAKALGIPKEDIRRFLQQEVDKKKASIK